MKAEKNRTFLTERDRYYLETSLKEKIPVREIAKILHKCPSCIYKEIKRGTIELLNSNLTTRKEYCADVAQTRYDSMKQSHGPSLKIGNDKRLSEFIEDKIIKEKLSPYAVSVLIKKNGFDISLSKQTIYRYIDEGLFLNLTNKHLPVKRNPKKHYNKVSVSLKNIKGRSIEERPSDIKDRDTFGHWELDSVIGKQGTTKCVFTVFTERLSRFEIVLKSMDKSTSEVVKHLNLLEEKLGSDNFKRIFKTITVDNGSEFLDHKGMETGSDSSQRTTVYYCHPYSSYERGSNENQNKLVRRWYPKGYDLDQVSDPEIQRLNNWINDLPRKIFNGLSSLDVIRSFLPDDQISLLNYSPT